MLNRSRVSSKMDVQRLGEALARPGMDPRVTVALAVVTDFFFDKDHGPFAEVLVMPDGISDTVRVGSIYAGPGFGLYIPLAKDDEVLVAYPSGEWDHGGVIISRQWSKSDAPPSEANDNKADLLLHVEKDKNLRIITEGQGNIVLQVDSGKVLLGNENNTQPVHRKGDHEKASVPMATWMGQVEGFINGLAPGTVAPLAATFSDNPGIAEAADGSDKVESA
jgi:hypothetical protein